MSVDVFALSPPSALLGSCLPTAVTDSPCWSPNANQGISRGAEVHCSRPLEREGEIGRTTTCHHLWPQEGGESISPILLDSLQSSPPPLPAHLFTSQRLPVSSLPRCIQNDPSRTCASGATKASPPIYSPNKWHTKTFGLPLRLLSFGEVSILSI